MRFNIEGVIGEITTMPGSSQIAISHFVFVPPESRGKGLGKRAMLSRLKLLQRGLGYDYVLCTVESTNIAQIRILSRWGWKRLSSFKSQKTDHVIELWGISLNGVIVEHHSRSVGKYEEMSTFDAELDVHEKMNDTREN